MLKNKENNAGHSHLNDHTIERGSFTSHIPLLQQYLTKTNRFPFKHNNILNIFTPIKCLKLIRSWFPEESANFHSVMSTEIVGQHALLVCRHCLL